MSAKKSGAADPGFDVKAAREAVDFFSYSTGVSCRLLGEDGQEMFACRREDACRRLDAAVDRDFRCETLHSYASAQSERFGGRYIYTCPMGMAFFASPIRANGRVCGAMVGGPVRIMDADDQLAGAAVSGDELSEEREAEARAALSLAPRRTPEELKMLSGQLFANAVFVSDTGQEMLSSGLAFARQRTVEGYISRLTELEEDSSPAYPLQKEQELIEAAKRGDGENARQILNDLLGRIFFFTDDSEKIRIRVIELFVVLTRAAAMGGANSERVLELSHAYLREFLGQKGPEELMQRLSAGLKELMGLVETEDARHSDAIRKAVSYMRSRCALQLPLAEVAEYVGYSPSYFSRVFKDETGMGFKEYLNSLRVEKSKLLLQSSELPLTDVCTMSGFNDQSYFCKVFRQLVGVSPDRFRKRGRRIDAEREYARRE